MEKRMERYKELRDSINKSGIQLFNACGYKLINSNLFHEEWQKEDKLIIFNKEAKEVNISSEMLCDRTFNINEIEAVLVRCKELEYEVEEGPTEKL